MGPFHSFRMGLVKRHQVIRVGIAAPPADLLEKNEMLQESSRTRRRGEFPVGESVKVLGGQCSKGRAGTLQTLLPVSLALGYS